MAEELAVATRKTGEPCGAGEFEVPSASTPGHIWTVIEQTEELMHCFCPWFQRKGHCRHVSAVCEAIGQEKRAKYKARTPEERAAAVARLKELEEMFKR